MYHFSTWIGLGWIESGLGCFIPTFPFGFVIWCLVLFGKGRDGIEGMDSSDLVGRGIFSDILVSLWITTPLPLGQRGYE
jgi:hypothetical protein